MSKLKELEKRLRDEPENLGLRVTVAGALLEVGRRDEGIELYRSVASAYRDQGRAQQAIAVCKSVLEIAPDDARCQALLVQLEPKSAMRVITAVQEVPSIADTMLQPELPTRRSTIEDLVNRAPRHALDETPLPTALPYHVADPTTHSVRKLSAADLAAVGIVRDSWSDDPVEAAVTNPGDDGYTRPEVEPGSAGLASAARRISQSLIAEEVSDVTAALSTRQVQRIPPATLDALAPPPAVDDDAVTPPPAELPVHAMPRAQAARDGETEEEMTDLRDLPPSRESPLPLPREPAVASRESPLPAPLPSAPAAPRTHPPTAPPNPLRKLPSATQPPTVPLRPPLPAPPPTPRPVDAVRARPATDAPRARSISQSLPLPPPDDARPTEPSLDPEIRTTERRLATQSTRTQKATAPQTPAALPSRSQPPTAPQRPGAITSPPANAPRTRPPSPPPRPATPVARIQPGTAPPRFGTTTLPSTSPPPPRARAASQSSGLLASAFFAPLPLDQRASVFARFGHRAAAAGATVIRQGEIGHPLFIVARGRLEVRFERPDGTLVLVGAIPSGAFVGEGSLLAHAPAPAHVLAAMDVELMMLAPRDFYGIAGTYPALWTELTSVAEQRAREHAEKTR